MERFEAQERAYREEFVESQWLVPASEAPAQPEAEGASGGQP
jgi:hypothetical protein